MPRIQLTPMARIALFGLSAYLVILLILIGVKFVRMIL